VAQSAPTEAKSIFSPVPHLLDPSPRVRVVDYTSQEGQALPHVVLIAPDILLGNSCTQGEETFHASWFSKDVDGMA